jgi:hypothetical protein
VAFVALIAGFAGVVFGAVLARHAGARGLRFKALLSSRWFGSATVRKRTALRRSLAESGTSLRLVPRLPLHRSSFVPECARCTAR